MKFRSRSSTISIGETAESLDVGLEEHAHVRFSSQHGLAVEEPHQQLNGHGHSVPMSMKRSLKSDVSPRPSRRKSMVDWFEKRKASTKRIFESRKESTNANDAPPAPIRPPRPSRMKRQATGPGAAAVHQKPVVKRYNSSPLERSISLHFDDASHAQAAPKPLSLASPVKLKSNETILREIEEQLERMQSGGYCIRAFLGLRLGFFVCFLVFTRVQ